MRIKTLKIYAYLTMPMILYSPSPRSNRNWQRLLFIHIFLFIFITVPTGLFAASVSLSWDANSESDLAGYKIYKRTLPSIDYGLPVFSGLPSNTAFPQTVLSNLNEGTSYGFIATAFDSGGNESFPSIEKQITISSTLPPPTSPALPAVQINFQPGTSPVPTGYLKDDGRVYNSTRGYGWSLNLTNQARDRNGNADQRLDTFIYAGRTTPATWRYDLPNGTYHVSLVSGDADYPAGPQRVLVEDQVVFNKLSTTANSFLSITDLPVTVADGTLTITLGPPDGSSLEGFSLLNYVQITPLISTTTVPLAVNISGTGTVMSSPSGLACSSGTCTADFFHSTAVTLTATPANGHTFAGWSGACSSTHSSCSLSLATTTSATATFVPSNSPLPPPSGGTPVQLNFQPGTSPVPTGYLKDDGRVYNSTRGYGWSLNLTNQARDRNGNADQRLDTFIYAGRTTPATWRYDLPNGTYHVSLVSGDADYPAGPQRVLVEDQVVFNKLSTTANSFLSITDLPVTVADGTLTITLGPPDGSSLEGFSLLNYVQITPLISTTTVPLAVNISGTGTVMSSPSGLACSSGTCTADFFHSTAVTLTATPANGHTFAGWSGACSSTHSSCSLSLATTTSATATFVPSNSPLPPPSGGTPVQLNFQPGTSPVPTGYLKDDGRVYNSTRGYGWSLNLTNQARDRNGNADQRLDTFIYAGRTTPATWRYDLPNGTYHVSLVSGDADYPAGPQRVLVEDQVVFNKLSTTANSFLSITDLPVTVADGTLTITLGPPDGSSLEGFSLLNYVIISPIL